MLRFYKEWLLYLSDHHALIDRRKKASRFALAGFGIRLNLGY
ncbi:hypothetical protein [Enterococcus sp.]|nr:hypothetical protein [Enterococcus sp.]